MYKVIAILHFARVLGRTDPRVLTFAASRQVLFLQKQSLGSLPSLLVSPVQGFKLTQFGLKALILNHYKLDCLQD